MLRVMVQFKGFGEMCSLYPVIYHAGIFHRCCYSLNFSSVFTWSVCISYSAKEISDLIVQAMLINFL